ncbi:Hint domain-containing protein [Rhodobacteraceae bacterium KMM 6894]|nr:Hint domain-containing protein [Rhodobacteraceae bacterium KMM 6894]
MPFIYVYNASDFTSGLPDESGAMAAGTPTFTLTLSAGATPVRIEVSDDDLIFDEVDSTQSLTNPATINGTSYAAGTTINTAYDLINTATGHKVTSFHMGGDGYQQGAVVGLVSSVPLTPGSSYTFNTERTSHQNDNPYSGYVACFTPGTFIATPDRPRLIETLGAGEMITTYGGEAAPLRALLSRHVDTDEMSANPNLRPIRILAGALGTDSAGRGLPSRDLLVSPQHRVLAASPIVQRMFGCGEVLIAACQLTTLPGVDVAADMHTITYMHLVMDQHSVVWSDGLPTESFYPGPAAQQALPPDALKELHRLFPGLVNDARLPAPARPFASGKQRRKLVARHLKNDKPLLSTLSAAKAA